MKKILLMAIFSFLATSTFLNAFSENLPKNFRELPILPSK
jgi:hypothetical protein